MTYAASVINYQLPTASEYMTHSNHLIELTSKKQPGQLHTVHQEREVKDQ